MKKSELIQINATMIVGILILLTISSFEGKVSNLPFGLSPYAFVSFSIVPFCLSAMKEIESLLKGMKEQKLGSTEAVSRYSLNLMWIGFLFVMLTVTIFVSLSSHILK